MEPSPLDSLLEAAEVADPVPEERPATCGPASDQEPVAEEAPGAASAPEQPPPAPGEVPKKSRKRGVPKIEADLEALRMKRAKKQAAINSAVGKASLNTAQQAALKKNRDEYTSLNEQIASKEKDLKVARAAAEAKARVENKMLRSTRRPRTRT